MRIVIVGSLASHVPGAIHIPLRELRAGNAGQHILSCLGFSWVANLSGGNKIHQHHLATHAAQGSPS